MNSVRFDAGTTLVGDFVIKLTPENGLESPDCPTILNDVVPSLTFSQMPEKINVYNPPEHTQTSNINDNSTGGNIFCSLTPGHGGRNSYSTGIPLELSGYLRSASDCGKITTGASIDIWQEIPDGHAWRESKIWVPVPQSKDGKFNFKTFLPGHLKPPEIIRPRHVNIRARAPGHKTRETTIQFHGDRFNIGAFGDCNRLESCLAVDKPHLHVQFHSVGNGRIVADTLPGAMALGRNVAFATLLADVAVADSHSCPAPCVELQECAADCDGDDDCTGDLICYLRDVGEPLPPGCTGPTDDDKDYCYNPPVCFITRIFLNVSD